jgi:hypothetical protein
MSAGKLVDVRHGLARNYVRVQQSRGLIQMNRHAIEGPGAAARIMIAALLAAAFMCAALPLASVSAANVCRLECCAARAPHAAGSCMNGTCHASLNLHSHGHRSAVVPADEFCGLRILAKRLRYSAKSIDTPATHESLVALTRPCNSDCGSCAVSSISAKDKITITDTYRYQSSRTTWSIESNLVSSNEVSQRQYSPRGPPTNSI